ncbi:MAG: hypothetical protein KDD38_05405 [Bdellovibrionales bacterium]|nr:hypothetical protein [Bdellovibrionales bacterium]
MTPREQINTYQAGLDFLVLSIILVIVLAFFSLTMKPKANFLTPSTNIADQREIQTSPELGY